MSTFAHSFNLSEFHSNHKSSKDLRSEKHIHRFGPFESDTQFSATMAARPNSNDKSSSYMQRGMSGDSSSNNGCNSNRPVGSVADSLLNSWFFKNQSSNSSQNSNNNGSNSGKFKADMNLWMPQSL